MFKKLLTHAAAFVGAFALAYSTIVLWVLPSVMTLPASNGMRELVLRMILTAPFRLAFPIALGAGLAFLPMRRRLHSWNVVSLGRTAIIGGLAGALWTPTMHTMFWVARAFDFPARTGTQLTFQLACGAVSALALYSPWLTSDGPRSGSTIAGDDDSRSPQPVRELSGPSDPLGSFASVAQTHPEAASVPRSRCD